MRPVFLGDVILGALRLEHEQSTKLTT